VANAESRQVLREEHPHPTGADDPDLGGCEDGLADIAKEPGLPVVRGIDAMDRCPDTGTHHGT
jgi:hypothetical protein